MCAYVCVMVCLWSPTFLLPWTGQCLTLLLHPGEWVKKSQSPPPHPMAHRAAPISVFIALGHASANVVKTKAGDWSTGSSVSLTVPLHSHMSSARREGSEYHFKSFWYDSAGARTHNLSVVRQMLYHWAITPVGNEYREFIAPGKSDDVYTFTMMLSSVTVIDIAYRKGIFLAAQYQLIYGPALTHGLMVGDHCITVHIWVYTNMCACMYVCV